MERFGAWRGDMVPEPAVFVVGDDQHCARPLWTAEQPADDPGHEVLAERDIGRGVVVLGRLFTGEAGDVRIDKCHRGEWHTWIEEFVVVADAGEVGPMSAEGA